MTPDELSAMPPNVLWTLLSALAAAACVQIYAGLELEGLYGDGAYCLRAILSSRSFACIEPARRTTQFLLELPAVLGVRLGMTSLHAISVIFSLTLQLAPLVLVCICCLIIPSSHRILFGIPVLHYFVGSSSIGSAGLIEGPFAAAGFWVILFLVLFTPERRGSLIMLIFAAIPVIFLHEVLLLLGPFLAAAAWWRSTRTSNERARLLFRLLMAWFLLICAAQAGFVVFPHNRANRDGFFWQFFGFMWVVAAHGGFNVPAVLGLLALLAVVAANLIRSAAAPVIVAFGLITGLLVECALTSYWYLSPISQFYARNHPAIVSLLLVPWVLAALERPRTVRLWATQNSCVIFIIVAAGTMVVQTASVHDWSSYVAVFRDTVRSRAGLLAWEGLLADLPPDQARLFTRMDWGWTAPDLSLLLSEHGQVRAIVLNPTDQGWRPWDPTLRAKWPTSSFFNTIAVPN